MVVHETAEPTSWFRSVLSLFSRRDVSPAGMIISVVVRATGDEVFRYIEDDDGDDDDHLLAGLTQDLASMSAQEFATRWA